MTKELLKRANELADQEEYLDRLFSNMQNDVDFNVNLDGSYRAALIAAFSDIKAGIRQEFDKL